MRGAWSLRPVRRGFLGGSNRRKRRSRLLRSSSCSIHFFGPASNRTPLGSLDALRRTRGEHRSTNPLDAVINGRRSLRGALADLRESYRAAADGEWPLRRAQGLPLLNGSGPGTVPLLQG